VSPRRGPSGRAIWMDGRLVPWGEATVHVLAHGLHYGTAVFEGVRAYDGALGVSFFRLDDHLARLERSAELYTMDLPWSRAELRTAAHEVVAANELTDAYVRLIALRELGSMGLDPTGSSISVAVAAWQLAEYFGRPVQEEGIRVMVSRWRRIAPDTLIPSAKAAGHYLNSLLAKAEAQAAGLEDAILLDADGGVCEASAENVFVVRDGALATPPASERLLDGITRRSIIALGRQLGLDVRERVVEVAELLAADEIFLTGTGAELVPVRAVDAHDLGPPGPITRRLREAFEDAVRGRVERFSGWLDPLEPRPSQPDDTRTVAAPAR